LADVGEPEFLNKKHRTHNGGSKTAHGKVDEANIRKKKGGQQGGRLKPKAENTDGNGGSNVVVLGTSAVEKTGFRGRKRSTEKGSKRPC